MVLKDDLTLARMQCLLIWSMVNLYLYRCPKAISPIENCTIVYTATYDADFMTMCTTPIAAPGTTTETSTETVTPLPEEWSPTPQSDTVPSPSPLHVQTTTQIHSEAPVSPSPSTQTPSSSTTTPIPLPPQSPTTTTRPVSSPSPVASVVTENKTYIPTSDLKAHTTIIHNTDTSITIASLVLGIVAVVGCIVGGIYVNMKHREHYKNKVVRPSQVDLNVPLDVQSEEDALEASMAQNKQLASRVKKVVNAKRAASTPVVDRRTKPTFRRGQPLDVRKTKTPETTDGHINKTQPSETVAGVVGVRKMIDKFQKGVK